MGTFSFAGRWGPEALIDRFGNAQASASVKVYESDGVTLSTLYTDRTKGTTSSNPFAPDARANATFFANPGPHVLKVTVGSSVTTLNVDVPIDPDEATTDSEATAAIAAHAALATGVHGVGVSTVESASGSQAKADAAQAAAIAAAAIDATTKANAAAAASQPLDSDLTAIALLSTTTYGRAFLALADAAAGRTALGLGTAATAASTAFDAAGAAAAAQAASQPVDSDLTAIAALSTTSFGRSFLDRADAAAGRTLLGLGTAATTDSASYERLAFFNVKTYGAVGDYEPVGQTGTDDTTAIQAAITAAAAVNGRVFFPHGYYKITAALSCAANVSLVGEGVYGLYGAVAGANGNPIDVPSVDPYLAGSVIVQCTAATDGIQMTVVGGQVHAKGLGILFDKTIRFTNTGHGINATPATITGGRDSGLYAPNWDNLIVFGHDGNHYAYNIVNCMMATWGQLLSYGGGGLFFENNAPVMQYGNSWLTHLHAEVFVGGTAHGVYIKKTGTPSPNLFAFGRLQSCVRGAGAFNGVTPTAPTSAQLMLKCDNSPYMTILAPDFETTVGSTCTYPTGGNLFLGPGGAGSPGGIVRPYMSGSINFPTRQMWSDLSMRARSVEAAGIAWNLFTGPTGDSLRAIIDGTSGRYMGLPGPMQLRQGPTGNRPPTSLPAGCSYFDSTLKKPLFTDGAGNWVDATGATVTAAASTAAVTSDAFTRSDSATTLGSDTNGYLWQTLDQDVWGISTNRAYCPTAVSVGRESLAWVVTNVSDVTIVCTLVTKVSSNLTGLVFRLSDKDNYWRVGGTAISKVVAGSAQSNSATWSAFANGDIMKVILSGTSIIVQKNGVQVASITDAFNQTATAHGLRTFNDNGVSRWDDFAITLT